MTNAAEIRKIQEVLRSIENGTPKFFNLTLYTNLNLVYTTDVIKKDAVGNDYVSGYKFHLTPKGKMYLNVII